MHAEGSLEVGLRHPRCSSFGGEKMLTQIAAQVTEPVMPPSFGILGFVLIVNAILFISALISIARNRAYTSRGTVVRALIVLAVPVLGPILWFMIGRRTAWDNLRVSQR